MNDVLLLKGKFTQKPNTSRPGAPSLSTNAIVDVEHIRCLLNNLIALERYWIDESIISGALITVVYKTVIAKSRRISQTFYSKQSTVNSTIVGAKFLSENNKLKHAITHYIDLQTLNNTIQEYKKVIDILISDYNGTITASDIDLLNRTKKFRHSSISRLAFEKIIVDTAFVERFDFPQNDIRTEQNSIISLYNTGQDTVALLRKIGISINSSRMLDNTTLFLLPDELMILKQKAPFLISMGVSDLAKFTKDDFELTHQDILPIPDPTNEPTIGVIDTLFDTSVYFSKWVEYKNMLDPNIRIDDEDFYHGTEISSIIVDGPSFNKKLDDGCGRFKVRHFGVAKATRFSSFSILRSIQEIIASNPDIRVWNLSLGSALEINKNFISPEAAILDKIQSENNVIFVIAGTNKGNNEKGDKMIGAPADSINSLVVNSVNSKGFPASYSRTGPVLSFFIKPDICYYGGDIDEKMCVCTPTGAAFVQGTSFAAPWIARKLSYLIDIIGLTREAAKALLIHSATGWNKENSSPNIMGYGVVPIHIKDILQSPKDEIRFIISEVSNAYDTYNYSLPVPQTDNKQPFIAKATLCYFPYCSRNQGVDYTNTEFDISLGRINKEKIQSIDNNYQSELGSFMYEEDARKFYRKWDNVKHIRETRTKNRPKKLYTDKGLWGISIKTKERLEEKFGKGIKFGLVISLKEINGNNRYNEFIQLCNFNSWIVDRINIENSIDIYNLAEEEIILD